MNQQSQPQPYSLNSSFPPQAQPIPLSQPKLHYQLLSKILTKSSHIPSSLKSQYLSGISKYRMIESVLTNSVNVYLLGNIFFSGTKWYKLTTNWKLILTKWAVVIFLNSVNYRREARFGYELYRRNEGVVRANWDNIVKEMNIQMGSDGRMMIGKDAAQPIPPSNTANINTPTNGNQMSQSFSTTIPIPINPNNTNTTINFGTSSGTGFPQSSYSNWADTTSNGNSSGNQWTNFTTERS